jgi:predicted sulfurtransferase
MNKKAWLVFATLIVFNALLTAAAASADAPRMSKEELRSRLGDKDIVIIDVRIGRDWANSDFKIRGAVREDPQAVASWAGKYAKKKPIVLYCA